MADYLSYLLAVTLTAFAVICVMGFGTVMFLAIMSMIKERNGKSN